MKIKGKVLKAVVKVFPKDSVLVSNRATGPLSKGEISEVLDSLVNAFREGRVPAFNYSFYDPFPLTFPGESKTLAIHPKSATLVTTSEKVRMVLREDYRDKYRVRIGRS